MMTLLIVLTTFGFQLDGWNKLEDVTFKTRYSDELETYVDIPAFGSDLRALDGKKIKLKGHFLPYELKDPKGIILSKFPYAACFFCGGAGLESIAEIYFTHPPRKFKPDEIITVEGTLKLNTDDFEHLVFIVKDANRIVWEDREQ